MWRPLEITHKTNTKMCRCIPLANGKLLEVANFFSHGQTYTEFGGKKSLFFKCPYVRGFFKSLTLILQKKVRSGFCEELTIKKLFIRNSLTHQH